VYRCIERREAGRDVRFDNVAHPTSSSFAIKCLPSALSDKDSNIYITASPASCGVCQRKASVCTYIIHITNITSSALVLYRCYSIAAKKKSV
jgi:hypothetical protein